MESYGETTTMTSSTLMEQHALAILDQNDLWKWPFTNRIQESGRQGGRFVAITPKLLYYLILESQKLGGTVMKQFWFQLGACDEQLRKNIESLNEEDFVSAQKSFDVLFRELDPNSIDFQPVLDMAAQYFTHVCVAFMNPGGPKSGKDTDFSVSEVIAQETETLLQMVHEKGDFGKRKQEALKLLAFKRDGNICPLTQFEFASASSDVFALSAELAHIIPNSVHGDTEGKKNSTLECISMFAGSSATDVIATNLNEIGNVMNMEHNAHKFYDDLRWGIEANEEGDEVKYIFRTVPTRPRTDRLGIITLREGDEIRFGQGPNGTLDKPIPRLCNIQLAVARVMRMSGAADIILDWKDQADDDGFSHLSMSPTEFCDMLDAKLFLSGRAVVA